MALPKRLLLFLLLLFCSSLFMRDRITTARQGSSALATLAASMQPGTWSELRTNGFTKDMIFPSLSMGGAGMGGITYAYEVGWDSARRAGYVWIGEHSSDAVCGTGTFDILACADHSQRFLKYDDATNTWSIVYDAGTGKGH